MELASAFTMQPFPHVPLGEVIGFEISGRKIYGLTISPGGEGPPNILCLSPGHPMLSPGEAGVYNASVLGSRWVAVYANASVVPSASLDDMKMGPQSSDIPSTLIIDGDEAYIVASVGNGHDRRAFDVRTGDHNPDALGSTTSVTVTSWKVVVEGHDGKPFTLFEMKAPGAA